MISRRQLLQQRFDFAPKSAETHGGAARAGSTIGVGGEKPIAAGIDYPFKAPMTQPPITIHLNGQALTLPAPVTLRTLIEQQGVGAGACAAEVNGKLVPRRDHESRTLVDGDRIELVTLVGGG